ncbi:leucine-rich repeat transmembrane protein FLRT3-like [Styela clava]
MATTLQVSVAFVVVVLVTCFLDNAVSSSTVCPPRCRCDSSRKTVYCMNKKLSKLPLGIPLDTKRLLLQNNQLLNDPDLDNILSSLSSLEKLELSNNSLTSFPRNLPRSLTWISMKDNDIKYIGSQSLEGLNMLKILYLDNNSITNQGLSPSAFTGASNLHTISLKWNRLTSVPQGLPAGIRYAHFGHNLINTVPKNAVQHLGRVMSLDLNNNLLNSTSFENDALSSLIELQYLDLSHNRLTFLPAGLPGNLTQLFASHNLVKSINAPPLGQERSMSLASLTFLEHLDLSFNRLQSVEPGSFSSLISLKTVILHDNPWQCDCHLKYLKTWLTETPALMTMDSNTICFTPNAFQGVTLRSLDHESLTCSSKQVPKYNISISPKAFTLSWLISDTSNPDYVEYNAFCGEPKCENCSQQEIIDIAERQEYTYVSSIVKSYDLFPTDYKDIDRGIARVDITNRKPGRLYIICLLGSYKDISELTISDCDFVKTTEEKSTTASPIQENEVFIPIWLAVLIAILAILITAAIVLVIYCQRLNAKKYKWKHGRRETAQMTYDPFRQIYAMPRSDSRNDRMYDSAIVGGVNISNFREGYLSSTQDAGKEFDVTLMVNASSNHNLLHIPSPETCESYCSDCHDDTISTTHTRTNTTNGSLRSHDEQAAPSNHHHHARHHQPPRYERQTPTSNGYESVRTYEAV